MATAISASCLCGAVHLSCDDAADSVGVCHCGICRRWCGGPFFAVKAGPGVEVSGGEALSVHASSDWGERGFCSRCGTSLFFRMKDGSFYGISAMAIDAPANLKLEQEIFVDEMPAWYRLAGETTKLTGEEVFARFNASGE